MFRFVFMLAVLLPSTLFAQTDAQPAAKKSSFGTLMDGATAVVTCYDTNGNVVPDVAGQPFTEPPIIAANSRPDIPLDIRSFNRNIPIYTYAPPASVDCTVLPFNLRNYGYQPAPGDPFTYGFPGPTIVLQKPAGGKPGDALIIPLTNNLSPMDEDCIQTGNPACNCPSGAPSPPQCCAAQQVAPPNCFHGSNTTNLHFHGTHVSPQKPQDYVLLELQPAGTDATAHAHEAHASKGTVAVGSFTYRVNPISANQPDGTQWYHPHKHGSTAVQVANGMAGALVVKGEFDDFLTKQFANQGGLTDHVMVIQQIHDLNFTQNFNVTVAPGNIAFASLPLINGQLQPVVSMRPNEIQRWRFVSATMEASAQIQIDFNGPSNSGLQAKQIAMDGVRFSDKNYQAQPLLNSPSNLQFAISPGNRADFLVKAPTASGIYALTYDVFGRVELQGEGQRQRTRAGRGKLQPTNEDVKTILEAVAPGTSQPVLLIVQVTACSDPAQCPDMSFPPALPEMPPYLQNIPTKTDSRQTVQFRLDTTAAGGTPGGLGAQPQFFGIGVLGQGTTTKLQQFNGNCANFTEPLGRTETWTLSQNLNNNLTNSPFHVFHIHTNHFQVARFGTTTYPDPIWMDSITLPDRATPSADDYPTDDASTVMIRQQFLDYTGAYVMHCHFLGHEDRGMMLMVQSVCKEAPNYYGVPDPKGGPDNCAVCVTNPSACTPALPMYPCATASRVRKAKQ